MVNYIGIQLINFIMIIAGLLLLFVGGELLVRGSVEISKRLGISTILIGVVVVGFGTSTPELLVSIKASLSNESDIALGNIVGSNIANVLLILGLGSIITPVICEDRAVERDSIVVVISSLFLIIFSYFQIINRFEGFIMFTGLIGYIIYSYEIERIEKMRTVIGKFIKTAHEKEAKEFTNNMNIGVSIVMTIAGIIMLLCGADFLVKGASNIARQLGVSEAVIGLSLVAVGTSLPELATTIVASIKKNSDVIIGNILGSNLFNILGILGLTSLIKPININTKIANFDIPFTFGISVLCFAIILLFKKFDRTVGVLFLIAYIFYIAFMYLNGNI